MPFQTGDVVKYTGKHLPYNKKGKLHIIHNADYLGKGEFQYSTNKGAWYSESDFTLVRKADAASFKKLDEDLQNEE